MKHGFCPECGQMFYGRSDKKFCDDYCRNLYNNRLNSDSTNYVRHVNNALRKNRRILENLVKAKTERIPWQTLASTGFDFSFCTHIKTSKEGQTSFYCYEYGFKVCNSKCKLIKMEEVS